MRRGVPSTRVEAAHYRFLALRGAKNLRQLGPAGLNSKAVNSADAGSSTRVEEEPTSLDDVSLESVEQEAGNGGYGSAPRCSPTKKLQQLPDSALSASKPHPTNRRGSGAARDPRRFAAGSPGPTGNASGMRFWQVCSSQEPPVFSWLEALP